MQTGNSPCPIAMNFVASESQIIVCEKTGRWAVAFRRALFRQGVPLKESRSLVGCGRELAQRPASVVAVEVTADNLEAAVSALIDWSRSFPGSRIVAVGDSQVASAALLLREAGAIAVLTSAREVPSVIPLVQRHIANVPAADLPLEQAAWASLPWSNWAAEGA